MTIDTMERAGNTQPDIRRFLDEEGRVIQIPKRNEPRHAVLSYLAGKFDAERTYTEREVNALLDGWHTFGDYFRVRRDLCDYGYLTRTRDGSQYRRSAPEDLCARAPE